MWREGLEFIKGGEEASSGATGPPPIKGKEILSEVRVMLAAGGQAREDPLACVSSWKRRVRIWARILRWKNKARVQKPFVVKWSRIPLSQTKLGRRYGSVSRLRVFPEGSHIRVPRVPTAEVVQAEKSYIRAVQEIGG